MSSFITDFELLLERNIDVEVEITERDEMNMTAIQKNIFSYNNKVRSTQSAPPRLQGTNKRRHLWCFKDEFKFRRPIEFTVKQNTDG